MAELLVQGTWGTTYGVGQVLFKATPMIFTGLAVDLGLRAGLFNIGAEGQLTAGSLAAAFVGTCIPHHTPSWVALPLALGAAMMAGAAWAAVPALMKTRFGAHEVISTIMMNRISDSAVGIVLGVAGLALPGTVRTADVAVSARLSKLERWVPSLAGSAVSSAVVLGIVAAFAFVALYKSTRFGREIVLLGMNARALQAENVPVRRRLAQTLLLSGAIAGAGSLGTVLGYKGYFEAGLGAGAGFGGVAVALLARSSAVGLVLAALLFGSLQQGGLALNAFVPKEVMDILSGVVVCAVALADGWFGRVAHGMKAITSVTHVTPEKQAAQSGGEL